MERTLPAAVLTLLAALVVVQVAYGVPPPEEDPREVTVEDLADDPDAYLGERLAVEGWYQGGLVRDANPLCANTREGVQREPYSYVFVDLRTDVTMVTGVKYRFVGTLKPADEAELPTVSRPIFVVERVEELGRNPEECQFLPDATATPA